MKDNLELNQKKDRVAFAKETPLRKPYHKPELKALGDLRTMTLGASPSGLPDSGIGQLFEKPADMPIPNFPMPDEFQQPSDPNYIPPL
jgi:hypothetical protein